MSQDAILGLIVVMASYFLGSAVASFAFDQKVAGSLSAATAAALMIAYRIVKIRKEEKEKRNGG